MLEKEKIDLNDYVFYNKDEEGNLWKIVGIYRNEKDEIITMVIMNSCGGMARVSLDDIMAVLGDIENGFDVAPAHKEPEECDDTKLVKELKNPTKSKYYDSHYAAMDYQTIEYAQDVLSKEEFIGAMKFQIMKYDRRKGTKPGEPEAKDRTKRDRYRQWLDKAKKGERIDPRKD